jgi:phage baseplate assembly protein gpV
MAFLLPNIGTSGQFVLKDPFAAKLLKGTNGSPVNYTLVAIRTFAEIVAAGGDVYNDYYLPLSIDKSVYLTDQQGGAVILTIQATDNSVLNVPNSYLASYPDGGSIPYTVMALGVKLGAIPDALDLSDIAASIKNLIKDQLGIDSTVTAVAVSTMSLVSQADHNRLEAARKANISDTVTDSGKVKTLQAQLDAANALNQQLQSYIASQQGISDPGTINTGA